MQLPIQITSTPPDEPCLLVDGHGLPCQLQLSHWPGHRTPADLRHGLSTGCALNFARLPQAERERRAAGARWLVNNHYDTDGVLALFTVRHPELALPRAPALLAAAAAGDFFRWPDDRSLAIDAIVLGVDRSPASPLAAELKSLTREARWTRCTEYLVGVLPRLLDGELDEWSALTEPVLRAAHADRGELERFTRRDDPARDLCTWMAGQGARADIGRHVLFGASEADRVLLLAAGCARLILSTQSWFDPCHLDRLPRPDLGALAARLNRLEGSDAEDRHAWRAQSVAGASPELWFGTAELELFVERNDALRTSRLDPAQIRAEVERALEAPA